MGRLVTWIVVGRTELKVVPAVPVVCIQDPLLTGEPSRMEVPKLQIIISHQFLNTSFKFDLLLLLT